MLPTEDGKRAQYPMWDGLMDYFPAALAEVARLSKIGNDKHNPGEPMHWSRHKSTDHRNKIIRHLMDPERSENGGPIEAVSAAWRALAFAQEILERHGWPVAPRAKFIEKHGDPADDEDIGGWIPWNGGECPIPGKVAGEFSVRFRDGKVVVPSYRSSQYYWEHDGVGEDITAYRLLNAPATNTGD